MQKKKKNEEEEVANVHSMHFYISTFLMTPNYVLVSTVGITSKNMKKTSGSVDEEHILNKT